MSAPTLLTTRLRLRQYVENDLDHFLALTSDEDVRKYVGGTLSTTIATKYLDDFIHVSNGGALTTWAVESRGLSEYVGHTWIVHGGGRFQPEVGVLVARRFWGQGFGPETLRVLSAFAKKALGYVSVYATVDIANSQSFSMLQSAGFCLYKSEHDEDGQYLVYHL